MLKYVGLFILAAVGGVLIFAAAKPDTFRVERSVVIQAPAEKIFPYLNDLKRGNEWSPWVEQDPNMKQTYSEPSAGTGAVTTWVGDKSVGEGSMTITESAENSKVVARLDFLKPFKAANTVEYLLQPQDGGTKVTWVMYGPQPYIGKIMSVFMDCEKMCGLQFDKGLAKLKQITEGK